MAEFDSNKKSEITRGLKHKGLFFCVIQYFGELLMVMSLLVSDGKVFGATISIDQDIVIISILAGVGMMFWAYNNRRHIRRSHTS